MKSLKSKVDSFRAVMFDGKGMERVFSHAGNTLTASFVIAAGLFAVKKGGQLHLLGVLDVSLAGYFVVAVGVALFLLNILDGLHQLTKLRQSLVLQVTLVLIYLVVTMRVAQLVLSFRSG